MTTKTLYMEKTVKPISGLIGLLLILICLGISAYLFVQVPEGNAWIIAGAVFFLLLGLFFMKGMLVIHPNHSRVLNFFGTYVGSVKTNGWYFVNPF